MKRIEIAESLDDVYKLIRDIKSQETPAGEKFPIYATPNAVRQLVRMCIRDGHFDEDIVSRRLKYCGIEVIPVFDSLNPRYAEYEKPLSGIPTREILASLSREVQELEIRTRAQSLNPDLNKPLSPSSNKFGIGGYGG